MLPDGKDFNVSIVSSTGYFLEVVDEGGKGVVFNYKNTWSLSFQALYFSICDFFDRGVYL